MKTTNKHSVLTKVAHGWDDIEAPIVAFISARLPFMMQGLHGNAKTSVGKLIGYIYGDNTFRYYDCSKANLLSMAGFPDAEKMRRGEQAFVANSRSLLGNEKHPVKVILLDELTRTPKDAQNMMLELIENRSIFGIPTGHEILIATANPQSYKGATKLDEALLDRFVACLPIPDYKDIESQDVEAMIRLNVIQENDKDYISNVGKELKVQVDKVRAKYDAWLKDQAITDKVSAYVANLVSICKGKWGPENEDTPYISGRESANQMWRAIIALAAYYTEVLNRDERQAFVDAAEKTIQFCWISKHAMVDKHSRVVYAVHKDMKFLLTATGKGEAGKLQIAFAKAISASAKVTFWETYAENAIKYCDTSMVQEMMGSTLELLQSNKPVGKNAKATIDRDTQMMRAKLYAIGKKHKEFGNIVDGLEGAMVCSLIDTLVTASKLHHNGEKVLPKTFEPYYTIVSQPTIKATDIVDMIVAISAKEVNL